MKLESAAFGGEDALKLSPVLEGGTIRTTPLIREIFGNIGRLKIRDLAYSAQLYLARSLSASAVQIAAKSGVESIGFTGGVACNELITRSLEATVKKDGFRFLVHQSVPPGDGGLSFGQAVVAARAS